MGKRKKNKGSKIHAVPTIKNETPPRDWLLAILFFLFATGFQFVVPTESETGLFIGWAAWAVSATLLVRILLRTLLWAGWKRVVVITISLIGFCFFAYTNIRERLRPSFVFVAPSLWLNDDTWYFIVNHRGSKTSYSVQILFADQDKGEYLSKSKSPLSSDDLNSEMTTISFPEVNPMGRGSVFAKHFEWKPFAPLRLHFNLAITWRDGGVNEELQIAKIQEKWAWKMKVKDRETGRELISCRDKLFPSNEDLPECFPAYAQPGN